MKPFRGGFALLKEYHRPYLILNLLYYGLVICAMIVVAFIPSLQQQLFEAVGESFSKGPLSDVATAYGTGQLLPAMILTFVVNLVGGSFIFITLPSLFIPFFGLFTGIVRALLWGLILSPTSQQLALVMIPHSLTLILEGQAYIIAMLAVYVHGRAFLWPGSIKAVTLPEGYHTGLKRSLQLYLLVIILLALAAIYEAIEVILIIPLLG